MESTAMVGALAKIRATFESPPSDMAIVRSSLMDRIARLESPEMPPILSADQRQVFASKLDLLAAFLESEDGADAVELLVSTFTKFAADHEAAKAAQEAAAESAGDIPAH